METKISLEQLLGWAKREVKKRDTKREAKKAEAATRREEMSRLDWNLDDPTRWQLVEVRHLIERQVCDSCGGEKMCFAQELAGFVQLRAPFAKRWRAGRGDALQPELPVALDIYDRRVPRCWDCITVDRMMEDLWHKK